jgi:Phage integrase family
MTTRAPSPGQLEQSFARVNQLQAELQRKERAIGRKVQFLAEGLAGLMEPGAHLHRIGVGLHAFDPRDSIRDRAILLVLLDTGLRLGELVRLSVGDVDLIEGRCRVMGKGAKERVVPIGGRTRRSLRARVVTRRRAVASDPLFISRRGGRLTPRAVQQLVHRLASAVGISTRCSPHVLRNSFVRAFLAMAGTSSPCSEFSVTARRRFKSHDAISSCSTTTCGRSIDGCRRLIASKSLENSGSGGLLHVAAMSFGGLGSQLVASRPIGGVGRAKDRRVRVVVPRRGCRGPR